MEEKLGSVWPRRACVLSEEDKNLILMGYAYEYDHDIGVTDEGGHSRAKDTPCEFHDGFSGSCWKGQNCVLGHEEYTGGAFVMNHPELAFAASCCREVTSVVNLAPKLQLNRDMHLECKVTHIVSPSEFYIRPKGEIKCICKRVNYMVEESKANEHKLRQGKLTGMDGYYYGFNSLESPIGLMCTGDTKTVHKDSPSISDKLDKDLNFLKYRKFQQERYIPVVELVAVRIGGRWARGVVISCDDHPTYSEYGAITKVRVQLIDTGEKVTAHIKNVCRLPPPYVHTPAEAFKCCLFGISPVDLVWCKQAVKAFEDLVANKDVTIIVKDPVRRDIHGDFGIFEPRPYMVQILVTVNGKVVDVMKQLLEKGFGLEWKVGLPLRSSIKPVLRRSNFFPKIPAVTRGICLQGMSSSRF